MKGLIVFCLVSLLMTGINPIQANADWENYKGVWQYQYSDGSYPKNCWGKIGGKWYYFDEFGYLCTDKIVPGYYYVNSEGEWSNPPIEVQHYIEVLKDKSLLKSKYNFNIADVNSTKTQVARIIDINDDGVYEAIVDNKTCHANEKASILQYKDGQVRLMGEVGYNVYKVPGQNIIVAFSFFTSYELGSVYEVDNDKINKIHTYESSTFFNKYKIDESSVSQEQFNEFMNNYDPGDIRIYTCYYPN